MIVEIRGVGYKNQGAALMLAAVAEHFSAMDRRVDLASKPLGNGSAARLGVAGLLRKLPRAHLSRSAILPILMSRWFRNAYGLVSEREVDAILDASGFAFGDQWGEHASERVVMLLAVGYSDPAGLVAYSQRKPLEEIRRYPAL